MRGNSEEERERIWKEAENCVTSFPVQCGYRHHGGGGKLLRNVGHIHQATGNIIAIDKKSKGGIKAAGSRYYLATMHNHSVDFRHIRNSALFSNAYLGGPGSGVQLFPSPSRRIS